MDEVGDAGDFLRWVLILAALTLIAGLPLGLLLVVLAGWAGGGG